MWIKLVKAGAYALAIKEISDRVNQAKLEREMEIARHGRKNLVTGMVLGGAVGAAAGILLAPNSGELTRRELATWSSEALENLKKNLDRAREDLARRSEEKRENLREAVGKCAGVSGETVKK